MMTKLAFIIFLLITASAIFLLGCASCPKSCSDNNICTSDFCSEETNYECVYTAVTPCKGNSVCESGELGSSDCPSCDDGDSCTTESIDYATLECINTPFTPCCGNGLNEVGETCSSCPEDVKCSENTHCDSGKCIECDANSDCRSSDFMISCNIYNFPDSGACLDLCRDGLCIMCDSDKDCASWGSQMPSKCKVSDKNSKENQCVECITISDCKNSKDYPVCDLTSNECVECLSNNDCVNSEDGPNCILFMGVKMCSEFKQNEDGSLSMTT